MMIKKIQQQSVFPGTGNANNSLPDYSGQGPSNGAGISVRKLLGSAIALVALTSSATAAINYVDITTSNTSLVGGAEWTPLPDQGANDDGEWGFRAFGNDASIYQNFGSGGTDDAERLQATVAVPLDTYNVYVYFWTDGGPWGVEASLTDNVGGSLPAFTLGSAGTTQFYVGGDATVLSSSLGSNPFTSDVMVAEGNRRLIQADLGQMTGAEITVFLDDHSVTDRTWLDGVGYEVVPEPSSFSLAALAGLGFLLRRRRR